MKILIVDDDVAYGQILQGLLEDNNHAVIVAGDGESAITMYKENSGVDLIITDYNMPKKDGLAVVREIKAIQPQARIWLVSNVMDSEIEKEAIEAGAERSIQKLNIRKELQESGLIN